MTLEKWYELYITYANESNKVMLVTPINWIKKKNMILNYIKNVDELTEIYNNENKGNK